MTRLKWKYDSVPRSQPRMYLFGAPRYARTHGDVEFRKINPRKGGIVCVRTFEAIFNLQLSLNLFPSSRSLQQPLLRAPRYQTSMVNGGIDTKKITLLVHGTSATVPSIFFPSPNRWPAIFYADTARYESQYRGGYQQDNYRGSASHRITTSI